MQPIPGGMFALAEGIATLAFIAVGFVVGLRLIALSRRTGGFAERSLGLGLFLIVGAGYPATLAGRLLLAPNPELARILLAGSAVLLNTGWACMWLFTWRVFRPRDPRARAGTLLALALTAACAAAMSIRSLTVADPLALTRPAPGYLGTQLLALGVYVWTGIESFRYYAILRRRLALGLADPVVANRFLLWGLVSVFAFASLVGPTIFTLRGIEASSIPLVRLSSAVSGLACAAALYLAFLPPRAYLARLRARAGTATQSA